MIAFHATRQGQTVTCYVHGESGVGKSALVRNFLDDLREHESDTVILEGRCYERESVSYKALDGVIDSLTKYLMALPGSEGRSAYASRCACAGALVSGDVTGRRSLQCATTRTGDSDPFTLRRRAFRAARIAGADFRPATTGDLLHRRSALVGC